MGTVLLRKRRQSLLPLTAKSKGAVGVCGVDTELGAITEETAKTINAQITAAVMIIPESFCLFMTPSPFTS